ncbi:MAG TPA: MBL fold metallo-hydrolase [Thermoclostridium sp.]|nr:MBL fold metallo-hydrolase [Thermoclostridium sp.]
MKLTMLGTGYANATNCYNTCFILNEKEKYFLVDGGGGNGLMRQLKEVKINWKDIRDIFVTHKHMDHLLGVIWMVRMICQSINKGEYEGNARIYAHAELIEIIKNIANMLLQKKETKFLDDSLQLVTIKEEQEYEIIEHKVKFFDIHSTKAKQLGFTMNIGGSEKLTCCGDEPCNKHIEKFVLNSNWLIHEAFCLHSEAEVFKPYEKHHSTVKDACQLAEKLNVKNLIIYHTEDKNLEARKKLYEKEGKAHFKGNLYIPDDLETIAL